MITKRKFLTTGTAAFMTPALAQAQYYVPTRPEVGIIFIAASWCAYCKAAAPVLDRLARNSDIPVMVVSTDNQPIAPFPEFIHDPQHPMVVADQRVPRTALYNATRDEITGMIEGYRGPGNYARNLQRLIQIAMRGEVVRG